MVISVMILLKNSRSSFENLRTNGARVEIVGDLPFMLSPVEAFLEIFSRVPYAACFNSPRESSTFASLGGTWPHLRQ
jgi:hypothetical protein